MELYNLQKDQNKLQNEYEFFKKTYNDYLTLTVSKCVLPEFKVKEEFSISKNSDIIVEGFPRKKTKKKNKFPKKKKTQNLKIKKKIIKRKKNAK